MLSSTQADRYRKFRADHPFLPASHALAWATAYDHAADWTEERDERWAREVDDFKVVLTVKTESIFPIPNRNGDTDFGAYVDELGSDYYEGDWGGNWPPPAERAPLGIPYTAIRFSGPGWVQGEKGGYFIPSEIEDQFDFFRRAGQSRAVAWQLTREWVEAQISMLFSAPLTNLVVTVTVYKAGIELGSTSMGTDVSDDDEGRAYIFAMVDEYAMLTEAIEEAEANIERITVRDEE